MTAKWLKYKETSNKVKGNYFFISQVRKTLPMKTPKIIKDGQFSKRINTQVKRYILLKFIYILNWKGRGPQMS